MPLNEKGQEVLDPTPVAIPLRLQGTVSDNRRIQNMIRAEVSRLAEEMGEETWEEADDFDVGDDYDPTSPYEEEFDPDTGVSLWDMSLQATDAPPASDQPGSEPGKEGSQAPAPVDGDAKNQQQLPLDAAPKQ